MVTDLLNFGKFTPQGSVAVRKRRRQNEGLLYIRLLRRMGRRKATPSRPNYLFFHGKLFRGEEKKPERKSLCSSTEEGKAKQKHKILKMSILEYR
jgi:hypothetical protein